MLHRRPLLRVQIVKSLRIDSRHTPKQTCFAFVRNAGSVRVEALGAQTVFSFYRGGVLIGHSRLESGDAAMAVAHGEFIPSVDFATFRNEMKPAPKNNEVDKNWRRLGNLIVRDHAGTMMDWFSVVVSEFGDVSTPFGYEAECIGLASYAEHFPEHVKHSVPSPG